jgi:hypothetical protein
MKSDYFQNPNRFPKNIAGPFYTTGHIESDVWCGDCLWCGAPEDQAPELLAPLTDKNLNTYFIRQPVTDEEIKHAYNALKCCCVDALRYGGKDPAIIDKLNNDPNYCDYLIAPDGTIQLAVDPDGEPLPGVEWWMGEYNTKKYRNL